MNDRKEELAGGLQRQNSRLAVTQVKIVYHQVAEKKV